VVLEFEVRTFVLARQVVYCLSHTSSPFWSAYFEVMVSLFAQAGQNRDPPVVLPTVAGVTDVCYCTQLLSTEMEDLRTFFSWAGLKPKSSVSCIAWGDRHETPRPTIG
jgi:hypothetical protein